ncbi:sigma-54 interaction domain-containing protein [Niallia endozanthoxylica]|uniref:PAS domain S-box protein n=1 Tax=Niallia endozanthoxylica TaxID=2036016 RepID=A0A5J5HWH5_9BACI|nr:sigma-54-dependent Fis family transcriptional regulator [Niallia endozanthoxylica]KAA9026237.1 PAS domain S-box protein [Niallia endozanthoxylica]
MQTVMIVGAGRGGTALLQIIQESTALTLEAVIDVNPEAPGMKWAREKGLRTDLDWRLYKDKKIDMIIEVTGKSEVFSDLRNVFGKETVLIPGSVAFLLVKLFKDKERLIKRIQNETYKYNLIFNSTTEGMIVINHEENVILLNKSAENMIGTRMKDAVGKHIRNVIPSSLLPRVMRTRKVEANQELLLENGMKIISTRIPIIEEHGLLIGAVAVFKEITEAVHLAEQITDLKEFQTKLEAIFHSSNEAISVVDEHGIGMMINPAYSRITGLMEEQVIGKPATTDIAEGESVHMKVLKTRREVRGVPMRVGPNKREVIVNGAPIIVDGKLKGSVGVIHDVSEIKNLNRELHRARQIIRKLEAKYSFEDIVGTSDIMKLALEQAKLAAKTPATILLRGESGTGKELFAHAIHNASDRKYNKFIRVNCAALNESLLESELFGYEEGAFTGAKRGGKRGLFEEADNGSIFLDEIGELSISTQVKLLRVLQENEIIRVGGTKPISLNVRVIAATNVNLEKGMVNGAFREDLFYRLNQMPIHIPALKMRKEDIEILSSRLIEKINQEYGRNIEGLTEQALIKLKAYDWPGNVRELDNILRRAIIFMNNNETLIAVNHLLDLHTRSQVNENASEDFKLGGSLAAMVEDFEKAIISKALMKNAGNKTMTAKELGLSIRNLYYKLEKYKIANISMQ